VRFLAKSTLFETAFGPILRGAGAIPVYRRLDQGVDPSRNAETFAAVEDALHAGQAVCVFPEGLSHSAGRLAPLRTGAARMVLNAERRGTAVHLVAVGLNFDRKTAFRSRVTVLYGQAFSARDLIANGHDEQTAARLLTDRIAAQMRRLLVEADPESDAAIVTRIDRLYAAARGRAGSAEERVARRQTIARGIERLRIDDEPRYVDIALRVRRYDQRLRRFHVRDRHLDWDLSTRAAVGFMLRETLAGMFLLPLALAGLVVFWLPYQATGLLARRATSERDVVATAQVFVGAGVYTVWLALIVLLIWRVLGMHAAAIGVALLPMLAIAGLFAIERETAVIDTVRSWLVLRRARHRSIAWLKQERSEIAALLEQVNEWLSAETPAQAAGRKQN
jgi:hypothetical protein